MKSRTVLSIGLLTLWITACWQSPICAADSIRWHSLLYPATWEAIERDLPLVVVFYSNHDSEMPCACQKLMNGPLASPEFNAYSNRAVFAQIDVNIDDRAKNVSFLTEGLKIDQVPVVVLLKVDPELITEIGRIVGYFDTPKYLSLFEAEWARKIPQTQDESQSEIDHPDVTNPQRDAGQELRKAREIWAEFANSVEKMAATDKELVNFLNTQLHESEFDLRRFKQLCFNVTKSIEEFRQVLDKLETLEGSEPRNLALASRKAISWYDHFYNCCSLEIQSASQVAERFLFLPSNYVRTAIRENLNELNEWARSDESNRQAQSITATSEAFKKRYQL